LLSETGMPYWVYTVTKAFVGIEGKKGFLPICTFANIYHAANNERCRRITLKWTILSMDSEGN